MTIPDDPSLQVKITPLTSQPKAEKAQKAAFSNKGGFEQVVGKISVKIDGKTTFLDVVWYGEEAESPAEEQIQEMAKALFETMQESKENLNPLSSSIEVKYKKYIQEGTDKRKYTLLSAKFIKPDKEIKMSEKEKQKLEQLKQGEGYKELKKKGRYKELPTFALVDKIIRKILNEANRLEFEKVKESEEENIPPKTEEEKIFEKTTLEGIITETTLLKNESQIEKVIIEAAEKNEKIQNIKSGIFNKLLIEPNTINNLIEKITEFEKKPEINFLISELKYIQKQPIYTSKETYKDSIKDILALLNNLATHFNQNKIIPAKIKEIENHLKDRKIKQKTTDLLKNMETELSINDETKNKLTFLAEQLENPKEKIEEATSTKILETLEELKKLHQTKSSEAVKNIEDIQSNLKTNKDINFTEIRKLINNMRTDLYSTKEFQDNLTSLSRQLGNPKDETPEILSTKISETLEELKKLHQTKSSKAVENITDIQLRLETNIKDINFTEIDNLIKVINDTITNPGLKILITNTTKYNKSSIENLENYKIYIKNNIKALTDLEQYFLSLNKTSLSDDQKKQLNSIIDTIKEIKIDLEKDSNGDEYKFFEKKWTQLLKEHLVPALKKDLKNPTVKAIYEALKTPEKEFIKVTTIKETNLTTNVSLTPIENEEKITEDEFKKIREKTEGTIEEKTEKNENGNEIKLTTEIQVEDKTPPNEYIEQFQNASSLAAPPQFPYDIEENDIEEN